MAYDIQFSIAITANRETLTITDTTVFGGSNPARNTVLVFLSGNKQSVDNTVAYALTITPNDVDPLVTSSWSHSYTDDGWYNYFYVIIKDEYDAGDTYNQYDAVYSGSSVYRSLINNNLGYALSNTSAWELITDPSTLAANKGETNESLNIESIIYQRIFTFNSQYGYGSFVAEASEDCCGDCGDEESDAQYNLLSLLVNGAIQCDYRTLLPEGETICRRLSAILGEC